MSIDKPPVVLKRFFFLILGANSVQDIKTFAIILFAFHEQVANIKKSKHYFVEVVSCFATVVSCFAIWLSGPLYLLYLNVLTSSSVCKQLNVKMLNHVSIFCLRKTFLW